MTIRAVALVLAWSSGFIGAELGAGAASPASWPGAGDSPPATSPDWSWGPPASR